MCCFGEGGGGSGADGLSHASLKDASKNNDELFRPSTAAGMMDHRRVRTSFIICFSLSL